MLKNDNQLLLIERIELVLRTDVRYLIKGNFWLGLGTVVSAATAFGTALAFGNLVAPEIYGTYRFVLSYYGLLALVGLSGFNAATVRAVALGLEGEVLRIFKIQLLASLVGTLVSLGLAGYYFSQANFLLAGGFLILGLALPLVEALAIYDAFLTGRKEFQVASVFSIITQLTITVLLVGAILAGWGMVGLLLTYFAGWIIIRLILFLATLKKYKPGRQISPTTIKLGSHLTAMGLLNHIANYFDRILTFHLLGAAAVAVYSFALAPGEQIKGFFKNINLLALPRFSERSEQELKKTMLWKMLLMALVVLSAVGAYVLAAPFLFRLFLPKYLVSVFPSQILALSTLGVIANLPLAAMKSLSKMRGLYFYNLTLPIFNIGLITVLTSLYGLTGLVLARLIGRISGIGLALWGFYRY